MSERVDECVGERLSGLRDCDCNRDGDPVRELEAEAGGAGLRKTYAKDSDSAASNGFIDRWTRSGLMVVALVVVCYYC